MSRLTRRSRLAAASVAALALAACTDLPTDAATPQLRPLAPGSAPVAARDEIRDADFVVGQVIVRYKEGADVQAVESRHRGRRKKELLAPRMHLLEVEPGQEGALVAELSADPDVEFAEHDYLTRISPCDVGHCVDADDPLNAYKWDLNNPGFVALPSGNVLTGMSDADIDWLEAFDFLGGDAFTGAATIAIIDSGIRGTHVEFANGRVIAARNFASGYPSTLIEDRNGHGTHVAGIAAGLSDGRGLTGVAYGRNIKLINAKACDLYLLPGPGGTPVVGTACPTSSQADAIRWAVDNGAKVLNLSLGGSPTAISGSAAVQSALQYAVSRDVLPVCASGNDNFNGVGFPARFPECFVVGATNWGDGRASYSNYGSRIDVVAPGGDGNPLGSAASLIASAYNRSDNDYVYLAGTSMAAPQVAGVAALLYATGMTSQADVRARLRQTADDLGAPGADPQFGGGRVNTYRALSGEDPGAVPVAIISPVGDAVEGSPVAFRGEDSFDPNQKPFRFFQWSFGDGATAADMNPMHAFADNGTYTVSLTVMDLSYRPGTTTRTVTVSNAAPTASLAIAPRAASGATVPVTASFGDAGVNDAPWRWTLAFGSESQSGEATAAGDIATTRRFCAPGTYPVSFAVTDKDGATSTAMASIDVAPHAMRVGMPARFNAGSNGTFPVRIHGSASLDVRTIDVGSVTVASGAGAAVKNDGSFHASYEDADGDGMLDLVVHVPRTALAAAGLTARTTYQVDVAATSTDGCTAHVGRQALQVN